MLIMLAIYNSRIQANILFAESPKFTTGQIFITKNYITKMRYYIIILPVPSSKAISSRSLPVDVLITLYTVRFRTGVRP